MVLQKVLKHYLSQSSRRVLWTHLYCFLVPVLSRSNNTHVVLVSTFISNITVVFKCDHLFVWDYNLIKIFPFLFLLSNPSHIPPIAFIKNSWPLFHCYCMHICICMCICAHTCVNITYNICIYIPKYNQLIVCDIICRHVFRDNHLVLVSQLVCSSLGKTISHTPIIPS